MSDSQRKLYETDRSYEKVRDLSDMQLELREVIETIELTQSDKETITDSIHYSEDDLDTWVQSLSRKQQAIFYGPPGTGKTYTAKQLVDTIIDGTDGFSRIVQFHQSYEYEDFIQGIRPGLGDDDTDLHYDLEPGTFLEFCEEAKKRASPCFLIIDEINRADLSSVFGELMYLLEYRDEDVQLAQSQEDDAFSIPGNVFIIGTMNTADRSIALVDFALRRRFAFISFPPNFDVLRAEFSADGVDVENLITVLEDINDEIDDPNYSLGHTYFIEASDREEVRNIWELEIVPYLEEFFIDQQKKVDKYTWNSVVENDDYNL